MILCFALLELVTEVFSRANEYIVYNRFQNSVIEEIKTIHGDESCANPNNLAQYPLIRTPIRLYILIDPNPLFFFQSVRTYFTPTVFNLGIRQNINKDLYIHCQIRARILHISPFSCATPCEASETSTHALAMP